MGGSIRSAWTSWVRRRAGTWEDDAVPVENSLRFAEALRQRGVPCDLHICQKGGHGMGLGGSGSGHRHGR